MRSVLRGGLVFALVTASAVAPRVSVGAGSDTNGDAEISVLDVQRVVAQVFRHGAASACADVNADGRVDILDLQRVLSEAAQAEAPKDESPSQPKPECTMPSCRVAPAPVTMYGRLAAVFDNGAVRPCAGGVRLDGRVRSGPQTERYLLTLTSHAPPVPA
ncbi:MAG: hypothetical protein GWP08_09780 [Nitrospiraceae bacterium]|nr:hypothetical protein [Nitrospiraceae bacterium]